MSRSHRLRGAVVSAVAFLVVAAGAPFIGAGVANAQVPTEDFCANVPDDFDPFDDVDSTDDNAANIFCLAFSEITVGIDADSYGPTQSVNRRQMALFIQRLVDKANELETTDLAALPAPGASTFPDVSESDPGAAAISQLDQAGIVGGFTDGTYRPNENVGRDQMASFIGRALDFLGDDLPAGDDAFTDDNGNVHEANINKLAAAQIVLGTSAGIYSPDADVTRRQMASFLIRGLAFLQARGDITELDPMDPPDDDDGDEDGDGNEDLTVTPDATANLPVVGPNPDTDPTDDREYTASDLDLGEPYQITLVPAENVTITDGDVAFADSDPDDDIADSRGPNEVQADITEVNGEPRTESGPEQGPAPMGTTTVEGERIGNVEPMDDGTITFTVDGEVPESLVPVVYDNTGLTPTLDLDADDKPTDPFGIGGIINYTGNEDLDVTPDDEASLPVVAPNPDTDPSDDREYTASDLDVGDPYQITLVPAENVTIDENGDVVFADNDATPNVADSRGPNEVQADITEVNGMARVETGEEQGAPPMNADPAIVEGERIGNVVPAADGTITFTVDGEVAESLVPVVYDNTGLTSTLDLDSLNRPTDPFGIGGTLTYTGNQANEDLDVTPDDDLTLTPVPNPDGASDDDPSDDREYTASDLDLGEPYQITLVPAENVTINSNGDVVFADDDPDDDIADSRGPNEVQADIIEVNGGTRVETGEEQGAPPMGTMATEGERIGDVEPMADGTITFTVDGEVAESLVPVVYDNTGATSTLDLDADNTPTDPFGIGGTLTYEVAAEGADGPFAGTVESEGEGTFTVRDQATGDLVTYTFDDDDTYLVIGPMGGADQDAFEAAISEGDFIVGNFVEGGMSNFVLTDVPDELSGLGGCEATTPGPIGGQVTAVDKTANTFELTGPGGSSTCMYDDTDTFVVLAIPPAQGIDAFEDALSVGDIVSGNYAPDGDSQFVLTDLPSAGEGAPTPEDLDDLLGLIEDLLGGILGDDALDDLLELLGLDPGDLETP